MNQKLENPVKLLTAASVLCLTLCANAAMAQQNLVPAQSEIVFVSKQMGVPVEGRFRKFDAQISFDPAKPESSKIAFTVDLGSASLGVPEVDAELPKPVWFNVPKFPQANFSATAVRRVGPGKVEVQGPLSIKGASQVLRVPVQLSQAGAVTTAVGSFTLKRLAFRIGDNEWADTSMLADDVQVRFKLTLSGVGKL
ncbi:MAG: YceI family protein [Rhodoferax sp.]|nr:YceI family protein [Rhodoferax sp.]